MKKKGLILSLFLTIFAIFSSITMAGCGTSIKDVKASFSTLDSTYKKYDEVFTNYSNPSSSGKYWVSYGSVLQGYINSEEDKYKEYKELTEKYVVLLNISSSYIDDNKDLIIDNIKDKEISKDVKNQLKVLNDNIEKYTAEIKVFVKKLKQVNNYFQKFNGETALSEESDEYQLMTLKKEFGNLVNKNINLSKSLAKVVEMTEIQKTIKNAGDNKGTIKKYIQAKLLPVYNNFMIQEISTKILWNIYKGRSEDLDAIVSLIEKRFGEYKTNIVEKSEETNYKHLSSQEVKTLLNRTEEFFEEAENYYKALKDLNIADIVKYYDASIDKYAKKNEMAKIDFAKIEQFLKITLPGFVNMVKGLTIVS